MMLLFSGVAFGIAVQGKPTAILSIFGLLPLIWLSSSKVKDLLFFIPAMAMAFGLLGYPQNFDMVQKLLTNASCESESWCGRFQTDATFGYMHRYLVEFFYTAILPSSIFLLARSSTIESIKQKVSVSAVRILIFALALSACSPILFILARPLDLQTVHYGLMSIPSLMMLFLIVWSPSSRFQPALVTVATVISLILVYEGGQQGIKRVHAQKLEDYRCLPLYRWHLKNLAEGDVFTVYTPRIYALNSGQKYSPRHILTEIGDGQPHRLFTASAFMDRFRRSDATINSEDRSREYMNKIASIKELETSRFGNIQIHRLGNENDCDLEIYSVSYISQLKQ
ncbi:hypothetical protein [Parahalioglobus pacificus]|uniref:hypothetical protein n=1 Tax=Parahalioglobus pacificus TaxID=930806 RepID=UPI0016735B96|nr:hypothetical protein [Halioglobus pacificus]